MVVVLNGDGNGGNGDGDDRSYLKQPRIAQVVSILRLLSIDDKGTKLQRNLIEIGTGEGKSLTLAVTSCILALLGFDVSSASYSEYLSKRDYVQYESLFQLLRIEEFVHYGTFNQLCERVINDGGNVRELVENAMIVNGCKVKPKLTSEDKEEEEDDVKSDARKKVLLIDEVDVFFSNEFYGNSYTPAPTMRDPCIKKSHRLYMEWL